MNKTTKFQRKVITGVIIAIAVVILFKIGFVDAVLWLIFALLLGFIPGTNLAIPPVVMFLIYAIAGFFLIKWIRRDPLQYRTKGPHAYKAAAVKSSKKSKTVKKRSSKRYSRGSTL
jgi:hypothetical protein